MPVDCPLIFRRKHHGIEIKLNKESEENSLKKFKVTLTGHYQKTISVYAETPEQVKEKTETILFDTDLIDFSDRKPYQPACRKSQCPGICGCPYAFTGSKEVA